MHRTFVDLSKDKSRGLEGFKDSHTPAVFSDAVRIEIGDCALLFISGKTALDADDKIVGRGMREQTRQVLENIKAVVEHEGGTMDDIVRVRVYTTLLDRESLKEIHQVRSEYFRPGRYPASTLVRVDQFVRDGALIEIDADAVIPIKGRSDKRPA